MQRVQFQPGVTRTGYGSLVNRLGTVLFPSFSYALRKAEAELFRPDRGARADAGKIIVLFTDGSSIDDALKPARQLRELKNVKIFVVSLANDAFHAELNRIAGREENLFGSGAKACKTLGLLICQEVMAKFSVQQ